ncbi:cytochrome c [Allopusillimonas ginsengisoli]|uniref:cytochrome c n=1 Tax=Allopusillimonas ginsengisoli TaxID=453575 RepID=UPI0039C47394
MGYVIKPASILACASLIALASTTTLLNAQTATPENSMALKGVMEKLGQDMQAVTGAISNEDWALVAELAPKIARHAEPPPEEKVRIVTWLGKDAGKFRGFDVQVHEEATAMGEAATRSDGEAVINAFAKVQQTCLACHQSFRKPFVKQFYGTP